MVEAIVVISVFIVMFFGAIYFKDLYHTKGRSMRLARAAALADAMTACKSADPGLFVQGDIGKEKSGATGATAERGNGDGAGNIEPKGSTNQEAKDATDRSPMPMFSVTTVTIKQRIARVKKTGIVSEKTGLTAEAGSRSMVACADEVRDGDLSSLISEIEDLILSKK
ncbi:MAG: hypothetical protein NVS3B20_15860 [Polyangiales bacterium]